MPSILCIGDSITAGDDFVPGGFRTWRGTAQTLLATAGIGSLDFVGPESRMPASGGQDPDVAAWGGAGIDSAIGSSNNITDRLASLKTGYATVDLIVLFIGWNDVYSAPTNIATRYETLLNSVQSGVWSTKKVICCTLHPEPGKTEAQTGASYAAYSQINARIRSLCAAAPSTRILADLAALSGADQSAFVARLIARAQAAPDSTTVFGGGIVQSPGGGHLVTSFKSIQDYNAQWTSNPPRDSNGNLFPPPGGPGGRDPNADAVVNGVNTFVENVQAVVPWLWMWAMPGHASSNTCIEVRNGFAQGWHAQRGWEFFFEGARFGANGDWALAKPHADPSMFGNPRSGYRADGITSWYVPDGNTGVEVWPTDTSPSRGIINFYGAYNRDLLANSRCFVWGLQARLALINPDGVDDRARARFLIATGGDYTRTGAPYNQRYDRYGWPLTAMDGGHDAWEDFRATDWTLIGSVTLGKGGAGSTAANSHWEDPGLQPPLGNWFPATPYNNIPDQSVTADQLRATPPRVPGYWDATGGSGSGYSEVDYWYNPAGYRDIHFNQSGADKVANVITRAIINSGALGGGGGGGGGGVIFSPLPGLPAKPNVFLRTESGNKGVAPKTWDASSAPIWGPATSLATAVAGNAYVSELFAAGSPPPTYSIVSGAPAWLSVVPAGKNKIPNPYAAGLVAEAAGDLTTGAQLLVNPTALNVSPWYYNNGISATAATGGYWTVAKTSTAPFASIAQNIAPRGRLKAELSLLAGTSTQASFGIYDTVTNSWGGSNALSSAVVVSGPGTIARASAALFNVTGLSATVATVIQTERVDTCNALLIYPDGVGSAVSGASVLVGGLKVVAGVQGSLPTGWFTTGSVTGLTQTIQAATVDGRPGIAVRYRGAAVAGSWNIVYGNNMPALSGAAHVRSLTWRLAAGSWSSVTSQSLNGDESNSGATYITSNAVAVASPTATAAQIKHAFTTTGTTASGNNYLALNIASGAVDFTLEFGSPQFEQAPTDNKIRNSTADGTGVPTYWGFDNGGTGTTLTVVGRSVMSGRPCVDVRIQGTPTASGYNALQFESQTHIVAATGQQWTVSCYAQRIAGSNASITSIGVGCNENTAPGAYVTGGNGASAPPSATETRYAFTRTFNGGSTIARTLPYLIYFVTAGVAVDITLRIAAPVMELALANRVRNFSALGASVGTPGNMPTYWATVTQGGTSRAVTATGTDGGMGFATVRLFGTPSANGIVAVYFDDAAGIPATSGEVVAFSMYQRLIAGTMSGLTLPRLVLDCNTAGGSYVTNIFGSVSAPTSESLQSQRVSFSGTLAGGGTVARVRPYWYATITAGVPFDVTIQFAAPQLESGTVATTPASLVLPTFFADPAVAYAAGTPPAGIESTSAIVFRATGSVAVDTTLPLRVVVAPVIQTTTMPVAVFGVAYSPPIDATGSGPITISLLSGTLPPGLSLVGGAIVGTPTVSTGSYAFTVRATGPNGLFDDQALTITCVTAAVLPVITTTSLSAGTVGTAYLAALTASGTAPIAWAASGVPPGLALQYHKSNVVPNSNFSEGTTGWSKVTGSESFAVVDGALRVTGGGAGAFAGAHRSIATVPGTLYRLRITIKATDRQLIIGLRSPILWPITSESTSFPTAPGTYELTHVAEAATMTVFVHQASSALPVQFDLDDVEIAPMTRNLLANPSAQGAVAGTPGTKPTDWGLASTYDGLSTAIVGRGEEVVAGSGYSEPLPYLDVRLYGTSATTYAFLAHGVGQEFVLLTPGQSVTGSVGTRIVAGALPAGGRLITGLRFWTAGYAALVNAHYVVVGSPSSYARTPATTTAGVGAVFGQISLSIDNFAAGTAVDFTLRIYAPQLERLLTANGIRNFVGYGVTVGTVGAGGVIPTNWADNFGSSAGLSVAIGASGVEDGIPYVQWRVFGTASATASTLIRFEANNHFPALPSSPYTVSTFVKLAAGAMPAGVVLRQYVRTTNAAGVSIDAPLIDAAGFTPTGAALGTQRRSATLLSSNAATAFVTQLLAFEFFTSGQAVDFTIRIGCPQIEPGTAPTTASVLSPPTFYADPRYAYISGTPTLPGLYPLDLSASNQYGSALANPGVIQVLRTAGVTSVGSPWGRFIKPT